MRPYPRLPVLGWSAFSGERAAPIPGVLDIRRRRYTTSGRAAIALALRALNVTPGDRVLVPTYHCPTMIAPVVRSGALPVFYPITASGSVDVQWLERADLAGARAMIAAHYFGFPQPMSKLRAFCSANRIALVEDCAHTFFGTSDGAVVGTWGDFAIASLPKFFPVPEGGVLLSATRDLNEIDLAPRSWRDEVKAAIDALEIGAGHARLPGLNALLNGIFGLKTRLRGRYHRADAPANQGGEGTSLAIHPRFDSLRPAVVAPWIVNSVRRSRIVEHRRRNYAILASRLSRIDGARPLRPDLPDGVAPYVFPLYVDTPSASYQRVRSAGIPIFRWDEVWPGTPALAGDHGLDWAHRVFQLGCHQDLSVHDIEAMAGTICACVRR